MIFHNNERKRYGRAKRGKRCVGVAPGFAKETRSFIGICDSNRKMIDMVTYTGHTERASVEAYLEKALPIMKKHNKKYLYMDNATYHKDGDIEKIALKNGITIIYLPPYSPHLNKIENVWGNLKDGFRKALTICNGVKSLMDVIFKVVNKDLAHLFLKKAKSI